MPTKVPAGALALQLPRQAQGLLVEGRIRQCGPVADQGGRLGGAGHMLPDEVQDRGRLTRSQDRPAAPPQELFGLLAGGERDPRQRNGRLAGQVPSRWPTTWGTPPRQIPPVDAPGEEARGQRGGDHAQDGAVDAQGEDQIIAHRYGDQADAQQVHEHQAHQAWPRTPR